MRHQKYFITACTGLLMAIPFMLLSPEEACARAGGGGGSSCKSWWCILLLPFVIANSLYISYHINRKFKDIKLALQEMQKREPHWAASALISHAHDEFMTLQHLWSEEDIEAMRPHLHPDLFLQWEAELANNRKKGKYNKISNVWVNKVRIVDVQNYKDDERDEFTVAIDATGNDQNFIHGKLKEQTNGSFREFWTFEWENGAWVLRNITQQGGWKRFVNVAIIYERH